LQPRWRNEPAVKYLAPGCIIRGRVAVRPSAFFTFDDARNDVDAPGPLISKGIFPGGVNFARALVPEEPGQTQIAGAGAVVTCRIAPGYRRAVQ
jgi:hypothetical protein